MFLDFVFSGNTVGSLLQYDYAVLLFVKISTTADKRKFR